MTGNVISNDGHILFHPFQPVLNSKSIVDVLTSSNHLTFQFTLHLKPKQIHLIYLQ